MSVGRGNPDWAVSFHRAMRGWATEGEAARFDRRHWIYAATGEVYAIAARQISCSTSGKGRSDFQSARSLRVPAGLILRCKGKGTGRNQSEPDPTDHYGWVRRAMAWKDLNDAGAIRDIDSALKCNGNFFPALWQKQSFFPNDASRRAYSV